MIPYIAFSKEVIWMNAGSLLQALEKTRTKHLLYLHKGKPLRKQEYLPECTLQNWKQNAAIETPFRWDRRYSPARSKK